MSNKTFLDIDDTILTKNLTLPETIAQEDNLLKQLDSKPFFIIQPTPGICVKAKTDGGEKIFLNICMSDKIPAPEDLSDTKLDELLSDEDPEFVLPMSIGSERLESDKGGSPCITYDIAINTTYCEKCQKKKTFMFFTIAIIMDGVANKFNKNLNRLDFVILKNRKVMGKLQPHRIEDRGPRTHLQARKPLIEEIKSSTNEICTKENIIDETESISSESINSKLNYVLLKQPLKGAATNLIGLFDMPKGIIGKDVEVLLDEDRIVITADKTGLTYDLSHPYTINVASVKCFLDKDLRVLRLDMPV
ncbi:PREDICTED: PIH1 domain-containing protein 1-like [Dufourea novaeangliae]|uniref:PIH1 domain-containing protein 1 n=1 Tax=Dufourea novaeangliae TaxID=178035 RepID=A0A154PD70_DUFNO|nr:PREDICTED: PIH1 domain-containing protein 1-like [Dufourea novaeangliae]KZC09783.1 PIH1 domain-containing protein 1 [Dufourea novaeangliae]